MQLESGERSILAYFPSTTAADRAATALKNAGIEEVQIDRVSRFGVDIDASVNTPINTAGSLSGITMFSSNNREDSDSKKVLLAADPSSSGIGDTNYGVGGRKAFMVTAITKEEKLDQAVNILEQHGGLV